MFSKWKPSSAYVKRQQDANPAKIEVLETKLKPTFNYYTNHRSL